ncbi:hypothetical protein BKA65DRAFT_272446 [Rhexocercosporidium sp. MPI-PUGE-AT-0058]|nr:hypothetical protein BKA65DRAFT_272446 [Rhexocercosporidium sp. MPI-PUGE-AT-0058]
MTTTRLNELNNGIFTSWIPFTTPGLSVAPACSSAMYIVPGSNSIVAFDPWQGINIPFALACLPSEVSQSWSQGSTGSTRTSLGPFHCPSLFTTATSSALNSVSTTVVCCPSDYGYTKSGSDQQCISTLKSGSIVPKSILAPSGVWESWIDATVTAVPTTVRAANVNGYVFAASTSSSTSSSSTSSFKTSSKSSTSTKKPKSTSASSKNSSGTKKKKKSTLGTGALVGIIIAAVLVAVLVILFVVLSRRKKRKAAQEPETVHEKDATGASDPKELSSGESEAAIDHSPPVVSAGNGHGPHEMDGGFVQPVVKNTP